MLSTTSGTTIAAEGSVAGGGGAGEPGSGGGEGLLSMEPSQVARVFEDRLAQALLGASEGRHMPVVCLSGPHNHSSVRSVNV